MIKRSLLLLTAATAASAHIEHGAGPKEGETIQQYAMHHMATEHHIDAFDLESFFTLHDFNGDGLWTRDEIEAVYGVHHPFSKAKSPDEEQHSAKANQIVDTVLKAMDKNGDGVISLEEFKEAGLDGLPNFSNLGAEGHHYGGEDEFWLHHEEIYHSTPETQTDEAYNHPEDIAHFENHEKIELAEENKEREYQGLDPLKELPEDHDADHAAEGGHEKTPLEVQEEELARVADPNHITPMDGQGNVVKDDRPNPRYMRRPKTANNEEQAAIVGAMKDAKDQPAYGEGAAGFKRPKSATDKLRRNLPYKYKFRRSWGDF